LKLSKRLRHIEKQITDEYDHIWDCCCDHGFLGNRLVSKHIANTIHFVDIVPMLISDIEVKLNDFHSAKPLSWKTHCIDVSDLPLDKYQGKHLVIISGVGGDLSSTFINNIFHDHRGLDVDFLLCPVNRHYGLRETLINLNFSLIHESLIEDKKRFYEILLVSSDSHHSNPINPVGDDIWKSQTKQQADLVNRYLNKTLSHYHNMQKSNSVDNDRILEAYQSIKL